MKYLGIIIVLVVILGGAYFLIGGSNEEPSALERGVDAIDKAEELKNTIEGSVSEVEDGAYELNEEMSLITWTARRPLLSSEHTGTFSLSDGTVSITDGVITGGSFTILMDSITDDGSGVVNHLSSEDFFDVATYPTGSFVVTNVTGAQMTGDLTLKDTTQSITFPFSLEDQDGDLFAEATFEMDRTQWGITFGSGNFFSDVGDKAIDDMVSISLELYATPTAVE